ncbi:DUF5518 domain-containing protein [Halomicroarcula sp. GCM10025709]|uniref:DUF5518 domain-containing protein n=1 Tax=Haloarcula TaxID=2237 RepID=UPI0024C2CE34|nr:DUF5518 domain-containing protein [Halomicroarcula sp. YJ-61-S]
MAEQDTLLNAIAGAVATAVLNFFVPFAPLFGGALAGYLEGGDRNDGLRVGLLAGVFSLAVLVVLFVFVFVGFGLLALEAPMAFGAFGLLAFLVIFVGGLVYVVGLSAAGGWLGNYLKYETDIGN